MAVRPNGNLLLTSLAPNASLYEVSGPAGPSPIVDLHFTIDTVDGLLGITETSDDTFAVVGGKFSATGGVKGSCGLWIVDFSKGLSPELKFTTLLPDAVLLNGATTLPRCKHKVLVADSTLGLVWRVDITTGNTDVAVQLPEMSSGTENPLAVGINGLQVHEGYLWWTNDFRRTLFRIEITEEGLPNHGAKAEQMAVLPASRTDDFIFGPGEKDMAWVTTNSDNRVFAVKANGESVVVAGATDSFAVAGATAAKFGRTSRDWKTLYISTAGGAINGTTQGGKVVALEADHSS